MRTLEWDYLFTGEPNEDWNQTLMTCINMLCETPTYPKTIDVPIKFNPLIKSLIFYKNDGKYMMIGDLYYVVYIITDIDYIEIDNNKLIIKNYGSTKS